MQMNLREKTIDFSKNSREVRQKWFWLSSNCSVILVWKLTLNTVISDRILTIRVGNYFLFISTTQKYRGVKDGYQILSWDKSQTQVIPSLSTIISYLQRSNVLWCPTLVLLSQTRFLLLLSGSYGYDRSCWFQAKMIINIRNELPSSCLGSSHKKKQ